MLNENRKDGAPGNTTRFAYDGENRIKNGAGTGYTYDGDGKRVKKSSGTLYWTGTGSDALAETDAAGAIRSEYVFFGGKRIARIDSPTGTPAVYYFLSDHLGTARIIATASGTVCNDADYYPFGSEQHTYLDTCPQPYRKPEETGDRRDVF